MNKRESNRLSMFNSVTSLLASNPDKISTIPVIGDTLSKLNQLLSDINNGDLEFKGQTKDKTADKNMKEEILHNKIFKIASAIFVLGVKTKNSDLMINAKLTKSEMETVRDNVLCSKCLSILTMASENADALINYGITAEMITEAQTALSEFQTSIGTQAEEFADLSAARTRLTELIKETATVIENELDPMMELFSDSDTDFYNAYQSARIIKDIGIRHENKAEPAVGG